jgi:hypothetical protein
MIYTFHHKRDNYYCTYYRVIFKDESEKLYKFYLDYICGSVEQVFKNFIQTNQYDFSDDTAILYVDCISKSDAEVFKKTALKEEIKIVDNSSLTFLNPQALDCYRNAEIYLGTEIQKLIQAFDSGNIGAIELYHSCFCQTASELKEFQYKFETGISSMLIKSAEIFSNNEIKNGKVH